MIGMHGEKDDDQRAVLTFSLMIEAQPERAFDLWLDPDMVRSWMALSSGSDIGQVEVDLNVRVGGRFLMVDHSEGIPLEHAGEYLVIDPPRLLEFFYTMPQYSKDLDHVSISIHPVQGGCRMDIRHELSERSTEVLDRAEVAWNRRLKAMKAVAASAI